MRYVIALRYSIPYFSNDVSSVELVLRNKDEGSCTMTQNMFLRDCELRPLSHMLDNR